MKRPQPSAQWRIYRYVRCDQCATWWQAARVRYTGIWLIDCPVCGEQRAC